MRITLVITRLITGGAERVITIMANYWASHDHEVTLITFASQDLDCYILHPRVKRVALNLEVPSNNFAKAIWHNVKRLTSLRGAIRASRPDVVISFIDMTNILTLLATVGLGLPVMVSERTEPDRHSIGFVWNGLRYLMYWRAKALVMQSHGLHAWARRFVRNVAVYVIPNPVDRSLSVFTRSIKPIGARRSIVAMGHLTPVKGYDVLVRAFARCASKHSAWSLLILGEGEERTSLEALVRELDLKDRVSLPGIVRDPGPILHGADLFVTSSHYEGSSNALLEAMSDGLAVISTDCGCSVREIIRDGVNGVLVSCNDVNALATAMDRLMKDQLMRERLGSQAAQVAEQFSVERVMGMWDAAIHQSTRRRCTHENSVSHSLT